MTKKRIPAQNFNNFGILWVIVALVIYFVIIFHRHTIVVLYAMSQLHMHYRTSHYPIEYDVNYVIPIRWKFLAALLQVVMKWSLWQVNTWLACCGMRQIL